MLFGADADDPEPQELTITITSLPDHGDLRLAGGVLSVGDQFTLAEIESLALSYLHDESETSQDSFGVSLADGGEDGAQPVNGIFELLINEVIDPAPVLENDQLELEFGRNFDSTRGDLLESGFNGLSRDSLENNTVFLVEIVDSPTHGLVELNTDGTFTYIHDGSSQLLDSFSYRVTNEDGIAAVASVSITIEPPIESAFGASPIEPIAPSTVSESTSVPVIEKESDTDKDESEKEPEEADTSDQTEETLEQSQFNFATGVNAEQNSTALINALNIIRAGVNDTRAEFNGSLATEPLEVIQNRSGLSVFSLTAEGLKVVSTATLELVFEVTTASPREVVSNKNFLEGLARLEDDFDNLNDQKKTQYQLSEDAVLGVTFSATVGALAWALRAGALFSSLLAVTPIWAGVDPTKIVAAGSKDKKRSNTQGDNKVETIFD